MKWQGLMFAKDKFNFSIIYLTSSLQQNGEDSAMLKLRGICYLEQNRVEQEVIFKSSYVWSSC
jgi:hypothetical protein